MSETPSSSPPARSAGLEAEFIARLAGLDIGERAVLKRNAGKNLAEARGCAGFYGLLPSAFAGRAWEEETCFLVATLAAGDRNLQSYGKGLGARAEQPGPAEEPSFASCLRRLAVGPREQSLPRRFGLLLDADWDASRGAGELPFRLRQLVRLALSADARIPWVSLLRDLRGWGRPDRRVQKDWARHFFSRTRTEQPENS